MSVFVLYGAYQGIPTEIRTFRTSKEAREVALRLAGEYGILSKPSDWDSEDGRWNGRIGSQLEWKHHWYDEVTDVIVAECEIAGKE